MVVKGKGEKMQTSLLRNILGLLACMATLAAIGCGGRLVGGGSSTYTLGGTLSGLGAGKA